MEMKSMMEKLERYLDGKKVELNAGKTKLVRFRKRKEKEKGRDWRWKEKKIEEIKKFKYLGYVLRKNGLQEAQVKDRRRKAATVMG